MRLLTASLLVLALGAPAFAQASAQTGAQISAQAGDAPKPKAACHASRRCGPARSHKKKGAGEDGLKAQSFTRCRDVRTHSPAKCGGPYAEPLPSD